MTILSINRNRPISPVFRQETGSNLLLLLDVMIFNHSTWNKALRECIAHSRRQTKWEPQPKQLISDRSNELVSYHLVNALYSFCIGKKEKPVDVFFWHVTPDFLFSLTSTMSGNSTCDSRIQGAQIGPVVFDLRKFELQTLWYLRRSLRLVYM